MKDSGISFFDTSVLIAAHDSSRNGHAESLALLLRATPNNSACAAHTLAEFYAVMSRLRGGKMQRPEIAALFVGQIVDRFAIIPLSAPENAEIIRAAAQLRIAGGTIFDALLVACARKGRRRAHQHLERPALPNRRPRPQRPHHHSPCRALTIHIGGPGEGRRSIRYLRLTVNCIGPQLCAVNL